MKSSLTMSTGGAWLVVIAAIAGCAVSVANYFNAESGIAGEPGTLLVIGSTLLLALAGWILTFARGTAIRWFFLVSSLLDIAGTAFAGYLLHSWTLFYLMLVALVGWLAHVLGRHRPA